MMKIAKRAIWFFVYWVSWMLPAIEDLKESGSDFAGLTALFLAPATTAIILPFLLWIAEIMVVRNGGPHTIFGFLPITLPVGFACYLMIGIIYHLGVGYGGSSWYGNCENRIL